MDYASWNKDHVSWVKICSHLDIRSVGRLAIVSTDAQTAVDEAWHKRALLIDPVWRAINPWIKNRVNKFSHYARHFCKTRYTSLANAQNKTSFFDTPPSIPIAASPASALCCIRPLLPLSTYIFTFELPTLDGNPFFITGHPNINGKVCLAHARITFFHHNEWRVIEENGPPASQSCATLKDLWTKEAKDGDWGYGELIAGCGGTPSIKVHISNPLTGATMTLPVENPSHQNSCEFGGVRPECTYGSSRGYINDARTFDIVTECFSPRAFSNNYGEQCFQSNTGLFFTFGGESGGTMDLSMLMVNHPLAQIICKSVSSYSRKGEDLRKKLNIAKPLDTREGDHGMLLSGYLDFSDSFEAHFKINLTQHFSESFQEGEICWGSYDKLSGEVLATLINCVSEMHVDQ